MYFHDCATTDALESTTGADDANNENIMQERTIITPSKHTALYDFKKFLPTL